MIETELDVLPRLIADHAEPLPDIDDRTLTSALEGGAAGYVSKECDSSEVVRAIRASARGQMPIDARVVQNAHQEELDAEAVPLQLTPRERDVLELLGQGLANKQIAERLGVTARTLRNDIERLREIGYPVDAVRGPGGGYRLGRGLR